MTSTLRWKLSFFKRIVEDRAETAVVCTYSTASRALLWVENYQ